MVGLHTCSLCIRGGCVVIIKWKLEPGCWGSSGWWERVWMKPTSTHFIHTHGGSQVRGLRWKANRRNPTRMAAGRDTGGLSSREAPQKSWWNPIMCLWRERKKMYPSRKTCYGSQLEVKEAPWRLIVRCHSRLHVHQYLIGFYWYSLLTQSLLL